MAELRVDALTGRPVLMAPERAARPHTFRHETPPLPTSVADCPFCVGNESLTPPEVARLGDGAPDHPGWATRVVPNKYPIIPGSHEVAILAPRHDTAYPDLDVPSAGALLRLLRDRCAVHLDAGSDFAHAFINHGRAAGASIEHPHAQVTALDFVPPAVATEIARFAAAGHDLLADSFAEARRLSTVVSEGIGDALAWCPYAAATTFEVLVAHRGAGPCFATDDRDDVLNGVAICLRTTLRAIRAVVGDAAYNVVVHTALPSTPPPQRWYLRVTPRLGALAGFEFGTGVFVNPLPPEVASAALRAVANSS